MVNDAADIVEEHDDKHYDEACEKNEVNINIEGNFVHKAPTDLNEEKSKDFTKIPE